MNQYFDGLCAIWKEEGGTVDDMVGDALVAFCGAPATQPDHAARAVRAARRIRVW